MGFTNDKELEEYRNVMQPPEADGFEDGFNWKAVVGAIFMGFIVNPATDYLSLVIGNDASIGMSMKWVMIIFFAEIARRSFTKLKMQELYVLNFMVGAALADPFSGYLFKQYMAQSEYVQGLGLTSELPYWAFPTAAEIQAAGRTLLTKAWLPIIGITLFGAVISRVDNYGLGYVMYRLASDVEKLPFPFAPMQAAGIVALAEGQNDKQAWRQRCFAIGAMMGMVWGVIFVCVPMITQVLLPQRIELIPMVFIDFTPQVGQVLPAVPFNLVINFAAFLSGMIVPWWGVVGSFIGLIITWIANPILQSNGVLSTWQPEMSFIDTTFVNNIDFYLSFGIGLTLAVTFSKLVITASMTVKKQIARIGKSKEEIEKESKEPDQQEGFWEGIREGWRILITNNKARGDFSIFGAVAIYLGSTFSWILLGLCLVDGYPWLILTFYALVYTPLISYATAKLEGTCGQAVNIPYLKEFTILLTGHKGADIWLVPMPIQNLGPETVGFRVLELTGTKIISQVKALLLTLPIVIIASLFTSEILWRMAEIPSGAYPWTEMMWELQLRQRCLMLTSTLEGGSQFLEAIHFNYAGWGLVAGTTLFSLLSVLGLPVMLVFGAVWGLAQSNPGAIFCTMAGACTAKFYFKRKYKDMWLKYMMVVMAGFGCGMGVTSMIAMAFNVIYRMIKPTLW
jgi:hypothetical protein